jgi:enoyl-CoA hydratase/carnithine racemase
MTEHVVVEDRGAVRTIRMNRPDKKNAITRAMYAAMTRALVQAGDNDATRACLIMGTPGAFSAGNDIADFMAFASGGALGKEVLEFLHAIATSKKPLVSAVDGLAIGIGTTIHLHCDLTFATPNSLFKTPFVDLALVPEAASSLIVPRLIGHQRAFAMLALSEGFTGQQALDAGLIYKVVDPDELETQAFAAAELIASKPPQALRTARDLLRGSPDQVLERIAVEAQAFADQLKSDEARAAFTAFMSRKK